MLKAGERETNTTQRKEKSMEQYTEEKRVEEQRPQKREEKTKSPIFSIVGVSSYINQGGEKKEKYLPLGVAFPLKNREGFRLQFDALPTEKVALLFLDEKK